jgi:hypothetical protein
MPSNAYVATCVDSLAGKKGLMRVCVNVDATVHVTSDGDAPALLQRTEYSNGWQEIPRLVLCKKLSRS